MCAVLHLILVTNAAPKSDNVRYLVSGQQFFLCTSARVCVCISLDIPTAYSPVLQETERSPAFINHSCSCRRAAATAAAHLDVPIRIRRLHPVRVRLRRVLQGPERNRAIPVHLYPHALSERLAQTHETRI